MSWKYTIDTKFVLTTTDEDEEVHEKINTFLNSLGTNVLVRKSMVIAWCDPENSKKREFNPDGTPKV